MLLVFGIIVLLFFMVTVKADCDDSFKTYLDCMAETIGSSTKGKDLENELAEDFAKLVGQSFDPELTGNNQKCVLSIDQLRHTDVFGPRGPLRDCQACQKVAVEMRKKFLGADETVRRCLRLQLSDAILDEIQPCIARKVPGFQPPPLPDFDLNSAGFLDEIVKSISYRTMAYSRLASCRGFNPARADLTESLLKKKLGFFKKHCDLDKACRSRPDASCAGKFDQVKSAVCQCLLEKKVEWQAKFDEVKRTIEGFSSTTSCSSSIKNAVGIWRYKLQNALRKCVPDRDNILSKLSIDQAIDQSCVDFDQANAEKRQQVVTGVRIVLNLLDAMNDRVTRFCEIQC